MNTQRVLNWANWILTAALGVGGFWLKVELDRANARQAAQEQEFSQRLREKAAQLEESRDRFARYQYVMTALADADPVKDRRKAILALNVARLALTVDEQQTLFASLELSSATEALGREASAVVEQSVHKSDNLETQGYEALANGDLDKAQQAFRAAETNAPSRHWNYELDQVLRTQKGQDRQHVLKTVSERGYLKFAPKDVADRIQKQTDKR